MNVWKSVVFVVAFSLINTPLHAAGMARVAAVVDSRTVVLQTTGQTRQVRLAGVAISPDQEAAAILYLREAVEGQWVLVEADGGSQESVFLYRSPDGLFINRDVSLRQFEGAFVNTHSMTILGTSPDTHKDPRDRERKPAAAPAQRRAPRRARRK